MLLITEHEPKAKPTVFELVVEVAKDELVVVALL
jgi:hypothetical protein